MRSLLPYVYKIGYPLLRVYWFFRRPVTQGVKCLIINDGRLLLVRQTYGSSLRTTVGGGVKATETLEEAVWREVNEEVGIHLDQVTKVGAVTHQTEYKLDTVHVFLAYTEHETLDIQTAEIREAGWYPLQALPRDVSPLLERFLDLAAPRMRER